MSSYRPQSPDLSSYPPREPDFPNTSNTYRPQSPDLSGLGSTSAQPAFHPHQRNNIPPAFAESAYRGPTTSFAPTSALPETQSHPHYSNQPPSYNMPPRRAIKEEDDDYMPDAYGRHAQHQLQSQHQYMPNNGSPMDYPQAQVKQEAPAPTDPTHGVSLKTSFPVARIKRIMQADEDIGKVAQVTPHVVSRALELFMIKLITASADQARGGPAGASAAGASKGPKRVLAQHLKRAIQSDETFDFLAAIIDKVPDAPASKAKKEQPGSDSEEAKPKPARKSKKRKDSGDDI